MYLMKTSSNCYIVNECILFVSGTYYIVGIKSSIKESTVIETLVKGSLFIIKKEWVTEEYGYY